MPARKKILLFSTLNPFPFWAGSENLWFDLVKDKRCRQEFEFTVMLADSPVTRKKAKELVNENVKVNFYKHFNVEFVRRNIFKVADKFKGRNKRTFPWYNEIARKQYDLVIFNVATFADLIDLSYAVTLCKKNQIGYLLLLQHGHEDFFFSSHEDMEAAMDVAGSALHFIFIAQQNRKVLERAFGQELTNAIHTVNAITAEKIANAADAGKNSSRDVSAKAKFFNLGRFSPKDKAQHLLLECFAEQRWKDRDWELNFIGVSDFGKLYLSKLIRYYRMDPQRVNLISHTDQVFKEISKYDVLLMPSMSEGTPFAMVESMACGKPAFGTPVGGIPELIVDGQTGWLSRTTAVQDISDTLERVWNSRNEWAFFGEKAKSFVNTYYNQETSFPVLIDLIRNSVSGNRV